MAVSPGPAKVITWTQLVGLTFFAVCGGDYGIEDAVGAAGARMTLLGLLVLPWVWSLPIAMMTAELSAMIPEAGGYVVWVHRAFGPFWAHQNAMWNLLSARASAVHTRRRWRPQLARATDWRLRLESRPAAAERRVQNTPAGQRRRARAERR